MSDISIFFAIGSRLSLDYKRFRKAEPPFAIQFEVQPPIPKGTDSGSSWDVSVRLYDALMLIAKDATSSCYMSNRKAAVDFVKDLNDMGSCDQWITTAATFFAIVNAPKDAEPETSPTITIRKRTRQHRLGIDGKDYGATEWEMVETTEINLGAI